jgi:hypothetical protein
MIVTLRRDPSPSDIAVNCTKLTSPTAVISVLWKPLLSDTAPHEQSSKSGR